MKPAFLWEGTRGDAPQGYPPMGEGPEGVEAPEEHSGLEADSKLWSYVSPRAVTPAPSPQGSQFVQTSDGVITPFLPTSWHTGFGKARGCYRCQGGNIAPSPGHSGPNTLRGPHLSSPTAEAQASFCSPPGC